AQSLYLAYEQRESGRERGRERGRDRDGSIARLALATVPSCPSPEVLAAGMPHTLSFISGTCARTRCTWTVPIHAVSHTKAEYGCRKAPKKFQDAVNIFLATS